MLCFHSIQKVFPDYSTTTCVLLTQLKSQFASYENENGVQDFHTMRGGGKSSSFIYP
jgi:hypothetical protein